MLSQILNFSEFLNQYRDELSIYIHYINYVLMLKIKVTQLYSYIHP